MKLFRCFIFTLIWVGFASTSFAQDPIYHHQRFQQMVELWNDYTQIYHRASNDADANKVWNQELLPVWGFNQSNGFKIDDLKGIFIVSSKDQNEKWVISEQEFIERYGKMIGFPSEEITSKWIAKYPVSPPTVREFQFIIQDAVENRPAQPDQITDYVVDILYNNQKSDAWKNLRKALNIDRLSSIGDPKAEFFYQSAYFVHTHEEKGTYDKKRLVLAFRELLEKVFSKEIKDTGNFKKAFEQCANNEFFGIEKDFIVSKNFILKNLSKKASSSKLPVEYVYHRFQNYGEFREFISFHNQQYPEPIFQIRTFEDYVRLHSQFLYPSLEQVSVSMRVPVSLMDLTYMFGPQELVINKKRYRSSGIMFRPESHQEMRSYILSHNSVHHLKPDLQVHTVVDWDRLSTQFGWENSRTIRGRLLFTDFDYYTGRSVKIREDSRNYRSRQSVKFTPTSHDQVRDFLLVHNLLYRNRPDLQIRHSGDWNRLATQFNLSFAQTIRRTLGSMDFEYYLGQAEEVKDKRIHRAKGSLVFVPSSHEELRFHLSIHNNNPEIPDSDRVFSSKDWDRIAAKYGWEFTVNIAKRLGSLDFEYYTGKSENLRLRKIMNVADLVSKVEKQIQEQPYSQSEIDIFLNEINQNPNKNKIWNEMLRFIGYHKKAAEGDPRANRFLQWSLFVHNHEKFQSREKYELVAAFRHVLLSTMFQSLGKNPDFKKLFSQAVSPEIGIFGIPNFEGSEANSNKNKDVQNGFIDIPAIAKTVSEFLRSASEKIGQLRAMYTLGDGNRFLPNIIQKLEGDQKKPSFGSFVWSLATSEKPKIVPMEEIRLTVKPTPITNTLQRMYLWNQQLLESHQDRQAEQGNFNTQVLKEYFSNLTTNQLQVLKNQYMKHGYFVFSILDPKSAIEQLNLDINGPPADGKPMRQLSPADRNMVHAINRHYDRFLAVSNAGSFRPSVPPAKETYVFYKEPDLKREKSQSFGEEQTVKFERKVTMDWAPDWLWYWLTDKFVPEDIRSESREKIALDPRMQGWFVKKFITPAAINSNYIEETPEHALPPELSSNHDPKRTLSQRIRSVAQRIWKNNVIDVDPESLEKPLILGVDSQIALLELEASQKPFSSLDFINFEQQILKIDPTDLHAKARKDVYERFKYQVDFENLTKFNPAKAEMLKQIILITHNRAQKKTYAQRRAVTLARIWIERNILKDMPFINEFREIYSEMISPEIAILGTDQVKNTPEQNWREKLLNSIAKLGQNIRQTFSPVQITQPGLNAQDNNKDISLPKENLPNPMSELYEIVKMEAEQTGKLEKSNGVEIEDANIDLVEWLRTSELQSTQDKNSPQESHSRNGTPENVSTMGAEGSHEFVSEFLHDLEMINQHRRALKSTLFNNILHDELHMKKTDLSAEEIRFVEDYLKSNSLYVGDSSRNSYVHLACERGYHPKIIQMLVKHGFNLNKMDRLGHTPWSLMVKSFQVATFNPERKLAFYNAVKHFYQERKINYKAPHFPANMADVAFYNKYIPERSDRKVLLDIFQMQDHGYKNPVIEMLNRSSMMGESLNYSALLDHVKNGVDIFDFYFDHSGFQHKQTQLHQILQLFQEQHLPDDYKKEMSDKLAEIILAAFEGNPKPNIKGRFKELALIDNLRIGSQHSENLMEADGNKKHVFRTQAEIYQRYALIDPLVFFEKPIHLDRFVYLARQLSAPSFEKFLDRSFKLSAEEKSRIYNYYSNDPSANRNTYNRTLVSQAIYAEIDVSYLRKMKQHGANFEIQNDKFTGHDVSGEYKNAYANNHHVDFIIKHVRHFKNKENTKNVLRFLVNEVSEKTHRRPISGHYAIQFGASMRELGFSLEETNQIVEKVVHKSGDVYELIPRAHMLSQVRHGFEKGEIKNYVAPETVISVALSKAQARDKLLYESSASNSQIREFIDDVMADKVKRPVMIKLMTALGHPDFEMKIDELLKDEKIREFWERGRFVHLYGEPNTEPKKIMFLEYFALSLKDLSSRIKNSVEFNEGMTKGASPEVLMFGKRSLMAKDVAIIISPNDGTESEKIIHALNRWNTLYPSRKIDTPRMWNKYRKQMNVPMFSDVILILEKKNITPQSLGIYVADKPMTQSKMIILTMQELRALILKHNIENPSEKILLQSTYEKLSGKFGYPSYGTLTKRIEAIDWKYVTGQTEAPSENLRARPSKVIVNNLDELRDLVVRHNKSHPTDIINSKETYKHVASSYGYMSYPAMLKKVAVIDWKYVTGVSKNITAVHWNRKPYTVLSIRSELALRELILVHNRIHPDEQIGDKKTYDLQAKKYGYPALRALAEYTPTIDWKYVTGETDVSSAKPRKSRTIYRNIKTELQLRNLIAEHNAIAPVIDRIDSREAYISVSEKYRLPSIHALYSNIEAISWKYVVGQVDQPEPNKFGKRVYTRPKNPGVIGFGPAMIFTPGGLEWFVYTWRSMMTELGASFNKWVERFSVPVFSKATALLKSVSDEVRGISGEVKPGNIGSVQTGLSSEPIPEPQDQKPEHDKNKTEYRVKHRGRTWSLEEIKAEVDLRNSQLPEAEKVQGMRELDRVSAEWNIPNREKINDLLKKNNKDRHWFFDTNFDALKKELALHHSKLPPDSPFRISSMSTSWDEKAKKTGMKFTFSHARQILKREGKTVKELFERTKTFSDLRTSWIAYNKSHPNHQIRSAEAWEERDGKIKTLVTSEVADDILQKEGASWSELLKITSVEDLKLWVKHYRKTNPDKLFSSSRHWDDTSKLPVSRKTAKMMLDAAGKDWKWLFDREVNLVELQKKRMAHNTKYPNDRSKRIETFSRDWDRNHKEAGLPPSRTVRGWLKNSQLPNSWFFQPVVTDVEVPSSKTTAADAPKAIPAESKKGHSGNVYSTVVPGLPQVVNWVINGGPQRVIHSVASTVSSVFNRPATTPEQKQAKVDAKVELYQIVADLKAIQNPFEQATALKEKETRISELTVELSNRSFESQKEMMRFLGKTVSEVKVLPVVHHMPKEFGKFFAALQLAHLFKMAKDNKITTQMFGEILRELPMETVRFGTFSAGASIATGIFYDIPEMLTLKIMQQHGYQALQEIKAMKMSRGLAGTLRTEAGMRAFARGQVGMLAGTVVNLLIYNPELPWDQVWKQALQTQVSFVIAGAAVRGIAVRGTVWAGAKILRSGFMALKGAYQGSKAFSGPVGIVIMAAEFALADPIGNFIAKVDKNSEAAAAVYENMIRLEYWLQNKTVPTMRFSDPCIQEPVGPTRGACYAQAALSALQMYNISMVYWPVQAVTQQFTEKQAKLDHRSVMSQLIEENEAERKEHGWGTPMIYTMAGMQSYRDDLAKLWGEYNAEANTEYYLIRQQLNSDYADIFKKLSVTKDECESENLIACGNELLTVAKEKDQLHQRLLSRVNLNEQNAYFEDWKKARLNKDWGIGLSFLDVDEWSRWVIYMAKRVGSIEVKDFDSSMVQQTFIHQALEQVKIETLFGTPDTIRRKEHNEKRNEEGYWSYAYSPDYRGFGLWGNIFAEKWNPQKTAIGNSHEDLAKNVAWMNRNKQIAQGYSLDLFTKNTLSLILPRGLKRFDPREQDLLTDLSYFYKCNWKRQNTLLSEFLVDSRSFERTEVYQSQKTKIRKFENEKSKNGTYRIPSDQELDQYFAERDASVANEQPLMFIQVYSQDEQTYRFGQEPMLVFKHATGVMKRDLETYASQMTCH